ncbi:hypothetical protein Tco_1097383 [Tanacetum coccineum]
MAGKPDVLLLVFEQNGDREQFGEEKIIEAKYKIREREGREGMVVVKEAVRITKVIRCNQENGCHQQKGQNISVDSVRGADKKEMRALAKYITDEIPGYNRILMCKTAKDIWKSLLITHQGNIQVKDNKIDLLVQQYEQFTILEEESIDSGFARFNTIITSLKALDEGFSSKNYVRKFLRALHPKWRGKVTVIKESKDLSSLALDKLIGNLKKESSDDETSTSRSDDEEYVMAVRNFKKFFRRKGKFVRQLRDEKKSFRQRDEKKGKSERKCFRCGDPNHLIGDFPKPSRNKDQKPFIVGSWSYSENDVEDKTNDETCLMA